MVRIIWVGEEEVLTVARAGFSVFFKIDEFIHDRAAVMKLKGPSFRSLRQDLSRVRRMENLETRPYREEDKAACLPKSMELSGALHSQAEFLGKWAVFTSAIQTFASAAFRSFCDTS